jgi:hypothetical protein
VYATLLLMSSTLGGDVAPAPGAVPAPVGCIGAPAPAPCCDSCDSGRHHRDRVGLLDRIRARHAAKGGCCGQPAPDCCAAPAAPIPAPVPVAAPGGCCGAPVAAPAGCGGTPVAAPCCDSGGRHGRARGHHRRSNDCCAPAPDCCAAPCATPGVGVPPAVVVPPAVGGTVPPKEMPKPMDTVKDKPKDEEASNIPAIPIPSPLPSVPSAPVAGKGTPY